MRSDKQNKRGGFTLVELMVVIVILGLLVSIVGTNVLGQSETAKLETCKMQVGKFYETVKLYMAQNRSQIPTWEDLITPDERGHSYLELSKPPADAWGNEYLITTDPEFDHLPLVMSFGPDGQEGTDDDITNKNLDADEDG